MSVLYFLAISRKDAHMMLLSMIKKLPVSEILVRECPVITGSKVRREVPIRVMPKPSHSFKLIFSLRNNNPPKMIKSGLLASKMDPSIEVVRLRP